MDKPQLSPPQSAGEAYPKAISAAMPRWGLLEWFLIIQNMLPAVLYFPGTQPFRTVIRILPFLLSLVLLLRLVPARAAGVMRVPGHPSRQWLAWAMIYILLMILHPTTNSLTAGLASAMLYFSVITPVYWAPNLVRSPAQLERLLWILLVLSGVNSIVGVLQVQNPDRWMPAEISQVIVTSQYGLESLTYEGPLGQRITRPTGLSDSPGAVSAPGMYAALIGTVFTVGPVSNLKKALSLIFALAGIMVIFLTHVRAAILVVLGMSIVYAARTLFSRFKMRAVLFLILALIIDYFSFSVAMSMGGESIMKRFMTLFAADPVTVYYESGRGGNLEGALRIVSNHPLGGGLGRWGMMNLYFGNPNNFDSPGVWAEIQLQAWAIDGGIILIALYAMALFISLGSNLRFARFTVFPNMPYWAYAAFALNVGTVALCMSYTPFTTQLGIQYWYLVGILHGTAYLTRSMESQASPPG